MVDWRVQPPRPSPFQIQFPLQMSGKGVVVGTQVVVVGDPVVVPGPGVVVGPGAGGTQKV